MIKVFRKLQNFLDITNRIYMFEWIVLFIIFIITWLFFLHYLDLPVTSSHGLFLLNCIFQGNFFSFYDLINDSGKDVYAVAAYSISVYAVFAVGSIPVKIIMHFGNIPFGDFTVANIDIPYVFILGYKLLPILFCLLSCIVINKIVNILYVNKNFKRGILYLFIGSPFLVFAIFLFGQYDSFSMFFSLLAIFYLLKNDKLKFTLFMSISITFKMFSLFIFIPLILLYEKKIYKLFFYSCLGLLPYLCITLMFYGSSGYAIAQSFQHGFIERIFNVSFDTAQESLQVGKSSVFLCILIVICVLCYITKINNFSKIERYVKTIYVCLAVYGFFFVFVGGHCQGLLLLVPFISLSLFGYKNLKISFILIIFMFVAFLGLVVTFLIMQTDETMLNNGLLRQIFNRSIENHRLADISSKVGNNIWISIFDGCLISYLVIKFPTNKRIKQMEQDINKPIHLNRVYVWVYIGSIMLFILPSITLYVKLLI